MTEAKHLLLFFTWFAQTVADILAHSFMQSSSTAVMCWICPCATQTFNSVHRFSVEVWRHKPQKKFSMIFTKSLCGFYGLDCHAGATSHGSSSVLSLMEGGFGSKTFILFSRWISKTVNLQKIYSKACSFLQWTVHVVYNSCSITSSIVDELSIYQ